MIITQTPLRISLAGGGTDIAAFYTRAPGAVVSAAIDKFIYVIVNQRFDDKIYLSYSKKEIVDQLDEIQHELVREALRMAGVTKGIEVAIMADIPSEGSGLGSSSSLTVGLLNAFYAFRGVQAPAEQLAREACEIEIAICKKPIGKQDQYIAAYGGVCHFVFHSDHRVTTTQLPFGKREYDLGNNLLLFFTNITRKADTILREQVRNTGDKFAQLQRIGAMAADARAAVETGAHDAIGALLRQNWALKCALAESVTKPEIDVMVARATQAGALGCKICGAGGGGFLLVYCRPEQQPQLRAAMADYREMPFHFEKHGSKVIFHLERYVWK
jgi:D-glycero-alpha-D-manno-heptose-7-phosphate kinase